MKKYQKLTLFLAIIMLVGAVFTACMGNPDDDDDTKIWWELGEEGRAAVQELLRRGRKAGVFSDA